MKRIIKASVFWFGVLLSFALPSAAFSRTIYVDWANVSGTEDGSSAHPFTTVARGYAAAIASDTIILRAGSYSERLTLNKAITAQSEGGTALIGSDPALLPYDLVSSGPDDTRQGCVLSAQRWDSFTTSPRIPSGDIRSRTVGSILPTPLGSLTHTPNARKGQPH